MDYENKDKRMLRSIGICLTMLSLTSCEVEIDSWYDNDDYSEVYYRKTHELCSRTWQESWEQDGKYYTQRLDFYENRTERLYTSGVSRWLRN